MYKNISLLIKTIKCVTILYLSLLGLTACSAVKSPVAYYSPFDFNQVATYRFFENDSPFFETQNISYVQRSRIELAIEKKLAADKFNYHEKNDADIIVSYHLFQRRHKDYVSYNKFVRFCSHCLKSNIWVNNGEKMRLDESALILDLIDPKTGRSVWRSTYPLKIKDKFNSQERNNVIIKAINAMLSQYPTSLSAKG